MCIVMCMRTNIVLNDALIEEALQYSKAHTKRGVVEEALATYVAVKNEERRRSMYRDRLRQLREKTHDLRIHSDSRTIVRQDRAKR